MKKYLAELFGTFVLVFFGCGTAVVSGGLTGGTGTGTLGVITIALAFGLAIVAAAYAIGHISGCHVNPAVSLAVLISGKMKAYDFGGYVIAQIIGAFAGSGLLAFVVANSDTISGFGANGYGALSAVGISMSGALVVEIILTFVFVLSILGVTSSKKTSGIAGIVIGLTLTFVHIIGIPLTGTSVNPARSLAPAIFAGGEALAQVWVFIAAPLVGAILAAIVFKYLFPVKDTE
jgi:aquaporin Z